MRGVLLFPAIAMLAGLAIPARAANLKLYTTDGEYQLVREYQVTGDRVKFYSVERGEWEEVPSSMVDLKRTQTESATKKEADDKLTKAFDDEEAAARAEKAELAKIPQDNGVYRIENGVLRTFPLADTTVHTPKGNTILRVLTPLPVIQGKATVELAGEHSKNVVTDKRAEFFFQLSKQQSFGLIKLTPLKGVRIAEHVDTMPISKEIAETRISVEIFTRQLPGENFYKVWPQEPLEPGEYGLIEYLDGKVEMRIWDFRIE